MNALEKLEKIATMKKLPRRLFQKLSSEGAFKIIYGDFVDAHPKVKRFVEYDTPNNTYLICIGDKTLSMFPRKIFIKGEIRSALYNAWLAVHSIGVFSRFDNMLSPDTLEALAINICVCSVIHVYTSAEYFHRVQGFVWYVNNDMIFEIVWNFKEGRYEITDYYFVHGKPTESLNTACALMTKKIENGNKEQRGNT